MHSLHPENKTPRMAPGSLGLSLIVPVLMALSGSPVVAGDDEFTMCTSDTAKRLEFIESRLEDGRRYAQYWWIGWTSFYSIGTVVTSAQAGLEDDRGERANDIVSAAKALFGTGRLFFFPPNAKDGADEIRRIEPDSSAACQRRLEIGEKLLKQNANESNSRYSWKRHASIVGINVAGALVVAEGFDERADAWTSAAVGIGIGEIMAWSHPWWGSSDLDDYARRFPSAGRGPPPKLSWQIIPTRRGFGVRASF